MDSVNGEASNHNNCDQHSPGDVGTDAGVSNPGTNVLNNVSSPSCEDPSSTRSRESNSSDSSERNESESTGAKESSQSAGSCEDGATDSDNGTQKRGRRGAKKRDRSKLRKGKWSVEEEEYTSRIIHYFSQGLLTLPEGATLRSYLADKLNCDPMRITKKYAGASCLGRRVYQYRDGSQPTIAAIQIAKAELDHLEQRFRMRVEQGHSHTTMPASNDMVLSISRHVNSMMSDGQRPNAATGIAPFVGGTSQPQPPQVSPNNWGLPTVHPSGQWLLPNTAVSGVNPPNMQTQPAPTVTDNVTNWALAQIAATIAPALSQIAASRMPPQGSAPAQAQVVSNILPMAGITPVQVPSATAGAPQTHIHVQEKYVSPTQGDHGNLPTVDSQAKLFAKKLQETYEQHLRANNLVPQVEKRPGSKAPPKALPPPVSASIPVTNDQPRPAAANSNSSRKPKQNTAAKVRTEEDKAAGSILLGLRQSYEDAVRSQQTPKTLEQRVQSAKDAAVVTDSSAQQPDSSVEDYDWNSDKKETSSSEESERESSGDRIQFSKGPPRKRMKTKRNPPGLPAIEQPIADTKNECT